MQITEFKLKYESCEEKTKQYPVIVVAAGSFSRMQGINKQLVLLKDKPVIVRTLKAFDNSPFISCIILVARKEDIHIFQRLADEYAVNKLTDIVEGGTDRHKSVVNGIDALPAGTEKVLIHDGARPLVTDFVIGNVTAALENEKAVICAVPICDTVKRSDGSGYVSETVDRTGLYSVQTPQGISVPEYRRACLEISGAEAFTDDAALMEASGCKVRIVEGDPRNIKITTRRDLETAEIYLEGNRNI